jgi:shikimate kinase
MKIFLIGMMGSGKSYWMDKLGRRLKLPRYDLDSMIESAENRTIQQIFNESGEAHFRKMESIVLRWFGNKDEFIVATGGGTPCFFDNMDWMNSEGITIWLDEGIDLLVERLLPEKDHRPLISQLDQKDLKSYLEKKRAEREIFYSKSKFTLSGDAISEQKLLSLIQANDHE